MKRIIKRILIAAALLFGGLMCLGMIIEHFQTPAERAAQKQWAADRAEERKRENAADAAAKAVADQKKAAAKAAKDAERRIEYERVAAKLVARDFVLARLKAPSTAKFGDDAAVSETPGQTGTYDVNSYVDSQNAFGAMIRTRYICTVKTSDGGNNFRLVNFLTY